MERLHTIPKGGPGGACTPHHTCDMGIYLYRDVAILDHHEVMDGGRKWTTRRRGKR